MENDALALWAAGGAGLLTLANGALTLWKGIGADAREAATARMNAHAESLKDLDRRITLIEFDEREEKGANLGGQVHEIQGKLQRLEGTALAEIRSVREKLTEVSHGVDELLGGREDDGT